jgi:hypothetical protein
VVSEVVTQAISVPERDEVFDQFSAPVTTPALGKISVASETKTQVINCHIPDPIEEDAPTVRLGGGHPASTAVIEPPEMDEFSQVIEAFPVVSEDVQEGSRISLEKVTEGDSDHLEADPLPPVTQAAIKGTQEPLFPQVSEDVEVVTPAVTTPEPAQAGPYEATELPLSEDWWAVKPDLPQEEPEVAEEPEEQTAEEPVENAPEEPQVSPEGSLLGYAPEVLDYLAVRSVQNATEDVKEQARRAVVTWLRREIEAGRLSQRSAAQVLNVSKTTIANWLSDDPWNVQTEADEQAI